MLSLIICSRAPRISCELEKNITQTIGCEFELVVIDNSQNRHSIFSAYNEGVKRALGDVLCFMHDDILYKTQDWGIKVEQILKDEDIGVVGVMGSYVMIKDYGYWNMMTPYVTGNVPGLYNNQDQSDVGCNYYYDDTCSNEVAILDGVWLCMRKNIFQKISFDERLYSGFHFYDMDICMQSLIAGYKNIILRDVLILHKCYPKYNSAFDENMKTFHKKWASNLPQFRGEAIGLDDKKYSLLCLTARGEYYRFSYYSVLNSTAFKLGNAILRPLFWLKKVIIHHQ